MGFGQVSDNLTFKHMTALRKKVQSAAVCCLNLFFATCNLKQIFTMAVRIKLPENFYFTCSDINKGCNTE